MIRLHIEWLGVWASVHLCSLASRLRSHLTKLNSIAERTFSGLIPLVISTLNNRLGSSQGSFFEPDELWKNAHDEKIVQHFFSVEAIESLIEIYVQIIQLYRWPWKLHSVNVIKANIPSLEIFSSGYIKSIRLYILIVSQSDSSSFLSKFVVIPFIPGGI